MTSAGGAGFDLAWIEGDYAITRLDPHARLSALPGGRFFSMTRTTDELSIVCLADEAPAGGRSEAPYALLRVAGELPLDLTGILVRVIEPLAQAEIPIFSVATFDTDYVLIRAADRERVVRVLTSAGHRFVASESDADG